MAEITLTAELGRPTGSRASGRLRAAGRIPGVVYGLGGDPVPVIVHWRELRQALTTDAGMNALINLHVDGDSQLTIVKELQRHPVRRDVLHVDFLRISRDVAIEVEVPIVLHGEAENVLREDGVLDQVLMHLTVVTKPASIPPEIAIDISGLSIGDAIRVGDLDLPAGVATAVDAEEPVVVAHAPQVSAADVEAAPEGEEAEAAEAGEAEVSAGGGGEANVEGKG